MEQRVGKLESDFVTVRERLSKIEGKLDDMPTKDWMNTRLLTFATVGIAIIGLMIKFL